MKKSLMSLFAVLLLLVVATESVQADVVAAPPAPNLNRGHHNGYPYYNGPIYNGPGAPFYNNRFPVYPNYPVMPMYPSLPYHTQFPFYFAPQSNPYWLPQQFYYPQQVFVCSFRGQYSGLFYTGWGINAQIAQNYAAYSCMSNEGSCFFYSCIIR